jgi:hypothetical protein
LAVAGNTIARERKSTCTEAGTPERAPMFQHVKTAIERKQMARRIT